MVFNGHLLLASLMRMICLPFDAIILVACGQACRGQRRELLRGQVQAELLHGKRFE